MRDDAAARHDDRCASSRRDKARVEKAPWGKHWWLSEPELTGTKLLTLVRVTM